MSNTGKTWTTIIVIIVIVIIGWLWYKNSSSAPSTETSGPATSTSDSSDVALQQDLSSVDGQMNDLNGDEVNADQGMSASVTP